ncbi:hypothetical protein [Dactylosporangium sp. CA-233914]|uniref:hypothetical protein n=1 Tax=Dactylosporangium sp. CA-233914 TaxID=3239934 RepID=UPI003D923EAF
MERVVNHFRQPVTASRTGAAERADAHWQSAGFRTLNSANVSARPVAADTTKGPTMGRPNELRTP